MNIGELAIQELNDAKNKVIPLTDGESFNQHNNIKRINRYVRGEFWECNDPLAIFWQLSNQRIPLYAKSIDADTKNFEMYGVGKFNWFKAFIANARFKQWAREDGLAGILDETSTGVATYGSMVWKKSFDDNGEVVLEPADLRNLYFDATVKRIIDTPVVEAHYMNEMQIRSKWADKADMILANAEKARDEDSNTSETRDDKYRILERWGEYSPAEGEEAKYYQWIGTGAGEDTEISLEEVKIVNGLPEDFPYYDLHGERVPGRWQGMGVVERLFGLQEQCNTLVNHNAQNNEIASLLLFKTSDETTTGNILDASVSGQVIQSSDLSQMAIDNRFISTFINQLQIIEGKADDLCYIQESISGELPPSGVPFRSVAMSSRGAVSTFKFIKTAMLEKMGVILQFEILPDVIGEFNKEDIYNIMEDDIDIRLYDQVKIEDGVRDYLKKEAKKGRTVIFEEELAEESARIQKNLEREGRSEKLNIDWEWGIRMNVTGESTDKNARNSAIDAVIEVMTLNPAALNTPIMKQKMSENGINPFRLTTAEIESIEQGPKVPAPANLEEDKLSQLSAV